MGGGGGGVGLCGPNVMSSRVNVATEDGTGLTAMCTVAA